MALREAQVTAADWQRCKEVFGEVLRLPEDARRTRLEAVCGGNEGISRAVEQLLAGHARSGGFLDPPVVTRSMQAHLLRLSEAGEGSDAWLETVVGGRYRLRERVGAGASGQVYRADDLLTGEQVACKVLHGSTDGAHGLRGEIAALRLLRVPGVVRMIDEGTEDGRRYMVTEFVAGAPFPGIPWPAPWARIAETAIALLEILARVHLYGFVHRDLKPGNVLVAADGRPTVLDLGLALHPGRARHEGGSIAGTPNYLSPEQLRGDAATHSSDLFAVGVMLYEALTGALPHQARTLDGLLRARQCAPPSLKGAARDCPPAVAEMISLLLRPDPQDRPRTAAEALGLVEGASLRRAPDELPWLGSDETVRAVVSAAERGQAVDILGASGSGRSRCLAEVAARLERAGRRVLRFRPGGGFAGLLDTAETAAFGRLDEAKEIAQLRLQQALRQGAAVLADDFPRIEPWVAEILSLCRADGAVVRVLDEPSANARSLRPLSRADLQGLFHGPDRVFHLCEDAADALHARSLGHPRAVAREVAAWVRAGHARWEGARLSVSREALDRLLAGGSEQSHEAGRADLDSIPAELRTLAAFVQIAGNRATPSGLAAVMLKPPWLIDAQLTELRARGVVAYEDGVAAPLVPVDVLSVLTQEETTAAHARVAESLPEGDAARLRHLVAARELGRVPDEARLLARRLADHGQLGHAISALGDTLVALDDPEDRWRLPLLEDLVLLGLRAWSRGPLDRALYEIEMAPSPSPRGQRLAGIARAALVLLQGAWERSLVTLEGMEPFPDARLELARQTLRVLAARRGGVARERAIVAEVSEWTSACGIPEARRSLLVWLGWLRYNEGRFAEAATLHAQAAALSTDPASRLGSLTSRVTALMDDQRLEDAMRAADEALRTVGTLRDPTAEARLLCQRRAIEYRLGRAAAVDAELPDLIGLTGVKQIEALAALTEAAVAWRLGDAGVACQFAARSARLFAGLVSHVACLPEALLIAASGKAGEAEVLSLAARSVRCPQPGVAVQALGLLAIARPDLSVSLGIPDALLDALPRPTWEVRREVLSVEEALYRRAERRNRDGSADR